MMASNTRFVGRRLAVLNLKLLTIFVVLLTGCELLEPSHTGFDNLPEYPVRPVLSLSLIENGTSAMHTAWDAQVKLAADRWNEALLAQGCHAMITVTTDPTVRAYPVYLIAWDSWSWESDKIGMTRSGSVDDGFIDIRARSPFEKNLPVLMHEFGHALGLQHVENGKDSVMTSIINNNLVAPTDLDAEMACDDQ